MFAKKIVAITGASGFLGKPLVSACLAAGYSVRVLSRPGSSSVFPSSVEVFRGDLVATRNWCDFVQGVHVLINVAAELSNPHSMNTTNVEGPKRLLLAAQDAGVDRWLQLSSVGAYGPLQQGIVTEQTHESPTGSYEISKTVFDEYLRSATKQGGTSSTILRPSIVYGQGMRNQSLSQLVRMLNRGIFAFIGPAGASANYVHVSDVVGSIMLAIESPLAANETFIVSDWATIECMVGALAQGLNINPPDLRLSKSFVDFAVSCLGWLPRCPLTKGRVSALTSTARYSTEKIENTLGWRRKVPVDLGMRDLAIGLMQ